MRGLLGGLQGGISTADRIVTVSPGYAWEIQTPEGGWGMEQMLGSRAYALNGVLNGIDNHDWNPQHDKHLAKKYSVSNFSRGKVRTRTPAQIALRTWYLPVADDIYPVMLQSEMAALCGCRLRIRLRYRRSYPCQSALRCASGVHNVGALPVSRLPIFMQASAKSSFDSCKSGRV